MLYIKARLKNVDFKFSLEKVELSKAEIVIGFSKYNSEMLISFLIRLMQNSPHFVAHHVTQKSGLNINHILLKPSDITLSQWDIYYKIFTKHIFWSYVCAWQDCMLNCTLVCGELDLLSFCCTCKHSSGEYSITFKQYFFLLSVSYTNRNMSWHTSSSTSCHTLPDGL